MKKRVYPVALVVREQPTVHPPTDPFKKRQKVHRHRVRCLRAFAPAKTIHTQCERAAIPALLETFSKPLPRSTYRVIVEPLKHSFKRALPDDTSSAGRAFHSNALEAPEYSMVRGTR